MKPEQKLAAIERTREIAADTLYSSLQTLLESESPISERDLQELWHEKLQECTTIFPNGWYTPPPHGIGVLFGTEDNYDRVNYASLRPHDMWPRDGVALNRQTGIVYLFASPVDREFDMIGDFGITLYFGNKPAIIKHAQNCLSINYAILNHAKTDMLFHELAHFADRQFVVNGLANQVTSTTNPAGVDIGHTIPASYENWVSGEFSVLHGDDWKKAAKLISEKRVFISNTEDFHIPSNGVAFTIEPRLTIKDNPGIPMVSFHTIAMLYPDGSKRLLTNYNKLFDLAGMNYMYGYE